MYIFQEVQDVPTYPLKTWVPPVVEATAPKKKKIGDRGVKKIGQKIIKGGEKMDSMGVQCKFVSKFKPFLRTPIKPASPRFEAIAPQKRRDEIKLGTGE